MHLFIIYFDSCQFYCLFWDIKFSREIWSRSSSFNNLQCSLVRLEHLQLITGKWGPCWWLSIDVYDDNACVALMMQIFHENTCNHIVKLAEVYTNGKQWILECCGWQNHGEGLLYFLNSSWPIDGKVEIHKGTQGV